MLNMLMAVVASASRSGPAGFDITSTLAGTYNRFETTAHATNMGWNGVDPIIGTLTLTGYCYSDSVNSYGMFIRNLPAGSLVRLVIAPSGSVRGKGGTPGVPPAPGENGGHALYVYNHNGSVIEIDNQGWIGAGGGAGRGISRSGAYGLTFHAGGGGGAGTEPGQGTTGAFSNGSPGTETTGGAGGRYNPGSTDDRAGAGGARGAAGGAGSSSGPGDATNSAAGAGGNSVVGNNRITWINVGTLYGSRVNN